MVVDREKKMVVPADPDTILKLLPAVQDIANITIDILTNKDSTNISPTDWTSLAMYIYSHHDEYDAFVVTHGTNTMAYTASALTLALGNGFTKPIVLTGSQLPLTEYGNDARFNFENAIKTAIVASEQNISEVMIIFDDVILRGCRAIKVSESAFRAFESPAFPELGRITSTGIHFNTMIVRKTPTNTPFELRPHFQTNVISIDLTPGLLPGVLDSLVNTGHCRGIILKSHGAGSVPTEDEWSLLPFIKNTVNNLKIPVVIATKFLGGNSYKDTNDAPAVEALQAGAIPAGDMTYVMTEVKLMWLLANNVTEEQDVRKHITKSYVGEMASITNI